MISNIERRAQIDLLIRELEIVNNEYLSIVEELIILSGQKEFSEDLKIQNEAAQLKQKGDEIARKKEKIYEQIRSLKVEYIIKYKREILSGGEPVVEPVEESLLLSTYLDQDSINEESSDLPENILLDRSKLLYELNNFLYMYRSPIYEVREIILKNVK
jgi:hypothetical protein